MDGYQYALAAITASVRVRVTRQDLSLPSEIITPWILRSASSVLFVWKNSKDHKALGVPKKERAQYSYMSTCNHILEQLITEDLDVYLMFLCTFTKRDAIDNDFLDLMMHDAMKGIEPAAQGETFEWKHFKQWQEKEYKWAAWQKNVSESHFLLILLFLILLLLKKILIFFRWSWRTCPISVVDDTRILQKDIEVASILWCWGDKKAGSVWDISLDAL